MSGRADDRAWAAAQRAVRQAAAHFTPLRVVFVVSDRWALGRPNPPAPLLPFAQLRGSATAAGRGREKPETDDVMKVRAPSSHHQFPVLSADCLPRQRVTARGIGA